MGTCCGGHEKAARRRLGRNCNEMRPSADHIENKLRGTRWNGHPARFRAGALKTNGVSDETHHSHAFAARAVRTGLCRPSGHASSDVARRREPEPGGDCDAERARSRGQRGTDDQRQEYQSRQHVLSRQRLHRPWRRGLYLGTPSKLNTTAWHKGPVSPQGETGWQRDAKLKPRPPAGAPNRRGRRDAPPWSAPPAPPGQCCAVLLFDTRGTDDRLMHFIAATGEGSLPFARSLNTRLPTHRAPVRRRQARFRAQLGSGLLFCRARLGWWASAPFRRIRTTPGYFGVWFFSRSPPATSVSRRAGVWSAAPRSAPAPLIAPSK